MDAVARQEYREFAIEFGEERIPAALTADPSPPAVWYAHQDPPQSIGELAGVLRDVKGVGVLLCVKAAHEPPGPLPRALLCHPLQPRALRRRS
jgi:hypothetical protein